MDGLTKFGELAMSCGLVALLILPLGCAHRSEGVVHTVRGGENLFRIAQHYGVPVSEILDANDIPDVRDLPTGVELWIPGARIRRPSTHVLRPPLPSKHAAEADAMASGGLRFAWPLRGRLTSHYGPRGRRLHEGLDIAASRGSLVRAAEAGRVVFSGRMGSYGNVVVLRHTPAYASVYAHHRRNRVSKGGFVDKGGVVGEVGTTGNASGPHLHFEIRRDEIAQDPLLFLP
ncbi:MAG: peptidoglycan DD-metalloendopeptidase family protein [Deltaproteobacteria bacterium]|nr:peptidoglycan DD-metalloendopeptidase family protein [Deltaproteobacteria bacterium]MBW2395710.1 peptidoglycan DD-metalloendopeptidase family protein [Deltaproteobacteria bacterium]